MLTDNAAIADLLNGQQVRGLGYRQTFEVLPEGADAVAQTRYSTGSTPTLGLWTAQDGRYCSLWGDLSDTTFDDRWQCYSVSTEADANGTRVIWIDGADTTVGIIRKK